MPRRRQEQRHGLPSYDLYGRFAAELDEALHHSSLGVWMTANHAELPEMMKAGQIDWGNAAASFKLAGLRPGCACTNGRSAELSLGEECRQLPD